MLKRTQWKENIISVNIPMNILFNLIDFSRGYWLFLKGCCNIFSVRQMRGRVTVGSSSSLFSLLKLWNHWIGRLAKAKIFKFFLLCYSSNNKTTDHIRALDKRQKIKRKLISYANGFIVGMSIVFIISYWLKRCKNVWYSIGSICKS